MQIAQAQLGNDVQNPDKFSELPPLVFHHIVSFLGVNDVARLCIVSPRCRELCISSPHMLFDVNLDKESCTSKCRGLRHLLRNLLDEHDGSELLQMHRFRLHWHCHHCKDFSPTSLFHRWVNKAVSCNAQEIDIGFFLSQGGSFILPNCLSRASKATRMLRLKLWGYELNCLPMDFASIQVLSLNSILVASGCLLGEWISRHFASLKTLNLEEVRLSQHLSITSSSLQCLAISHCPIEADVSVQCPFLEYLRVEHCTTTNTMVVLTVKCGELKSLLVHDCHFDFVRLSILGPSLKDFQICRCFIKHFMFYNISAENLCTFTRDNTLAPAAIMIEFFGSVQFMERLTLKLSVMWGDHLRSFAVEFFKNFNIHVLEIDVFTIMVLNLKEMGIVFPNLHHLKVAVDTLRDMSPTNIATFVIDMCSASVGLKTVTLNYYGCQSNDVVRLLKSAVQLVRREISAAVEINCEDAAVRYSRSWSK